MGCTIQPTGGRTGAAKGKETCIFLPRQHISFQKANARMVECGFMVRVRIGDARVLLTWPHRHLWHVSVHVRMYMSKYRSLHSSLCRASKYANAHVYTHVYTHVYCITIHMSIRMSICTCRHTCLCKGLYTSIHVCHVCLYTCRHRGHAHVHMSTHVSTHMAIHMSTQMASHMVTSMSRHMSARMSMHMCTTAPGMRVAGSRACPRGMIRA